MRESLDASAWIDWPRHSVTSLALLQHTHTQIGAGVHYSVGLGRDGKLYVWGTLGLAVADAAPAAAAAAAGGGGGARQEEKPVWDVAGALNEVHRPSSTVQQISLACGPYHVVAASLG